MEQETKALLERVSSFLHDCVDVGHATPDLEEFKRLLSDVDTALQTA